MELTTKMKQKLNNCVIEDFSFFQIQEIKKGFVNGLSMEQVELYAKKEFDSIEMNYIRKSLENGLSVEQVNNLLEKGTIPYYIHTFSNFLKDGVPIEQATKQLELLLKFQESHYYENDVILEGLYNGLTIEQVSFYAKEKFDYIEMNYIRQMLENGFSTKQIQKGLDSNFSVEQVYRIFLGLQNGLSKEQIKSYVKYKENCSISIIDVVIDGLKNGLNIEQIKAYDELEALPYVCESLKNGMNVEQIENQYQDLKNMYIYSPNKKYKYKDEDIYQIISFFSNDLDKGQFEDLLQEGFDFSQIEVISKGIKKGLTNEQISLYAKKELSNIDMNIIVDAFECGLNVEQIKKEMMFNNSLQVREEMSLFFPKEQVKTYINNGIPFFNFCNYLNLQSLQTYEDIREAKKELANNVTPSERVLLFQNLIKEDFDFSQKEATAIGIFEGYTKEQIEFYAKKEINGSKMSYIRDLLYEGFTTEQIPTIIDILDTMYNKKENSYDNKIVKLGFMIGLTEEQVKSYANPEYSEEEMLKKLKDICQKNNEMMELNCAVDSFFEYIENDEEDFER